MAKRKRTNNDLQNTTQKTSNTNPTKNRGSTQGLGSLSSSCSISGIRRVNLDTNTADRQCYELQQLESGKHGVWELNIVSPVRGT